MSKVEVYGNEVVSTVLDYNRKPTFVVQVLHVQGFAIVWMVPVTAVLQLCCSLMSFLNVLYIPAAINWGTGGYTVPPCYSHDALMAIIRSPQYQVGALTHSSRNTRTVLGGRRVPNNFHVIIVNSMHGMAWQQADVR